MSSMSLSNNQKNELLFVGFNQDYGELASFFCYDFLPSVILPAFYNSARMSIKKSVPGVIKYGENV